MNVNIIETVRKAAAQNPDATALWSVDGELSYADFVRRVDGLAEALHTRGIGPGNRVAVCLDRSPEMIIGIFGILACGAAYVPLDNENPHSRLRNVIEDSRPSLLLRRGGEESLGETVGVEYLDPADWPLEGSSMSVPHDGPAYVIYTSGSTGRPKGVVIGHGSLENYLDWALGALPFCGGGAPLFGSISFDHSVTTVFPVLMKGEPLFLLPSIQNGRTVAKNLLTDRYYSYVKITPSHFSLLDTDERARLGSATAMVVFGGERLPPEFIGQLRRDNPNAAVMNHYGPTETTVGCCVYRVPYGFSLSTVPIGRPIPGATASIRRPDLTLAEKGECGELLIAGKVLAEHYWSRPDLTEKAFIELPDGDGVPCRWYRTGDLVRCLGDDNFEYLGRNDRQIKVLGHRIEPGEIEQMLSSHLQVREAVILDPESQATTCLIAAVTVSGPDVTEEDLKRYVRERLPSVMVPTRILLLQRFPVTVNGKLDRHSLAAMALRRTQQPVSQSSIEDLLILRFREALGVGHVRPEDDFFELGGDSQAAIEIALWVAEHFQIYLELAAFFRYPTVASLAERIRSLSADAGSV
jgi:amino acid adenylation domain-containing protein